MKILAIALIAFGLAGLAYGGISWTSREKVVDLGPLEVTQNKTKSIPLPPVAGGVCLIAGVVILLASNRRS